MICRQLRYEVDGGQSKKMYCNLSYCMYLSISCMSKCILWQGSGPTWLGYLYYTGTESIYLECLRPNGIGYILFSHSEDVSVVCPG